MHCEKNVCDSLLGTVLCLDGKTNKDNLKARKYLETMGIRRELWVQKDNRGRSMLPMAKFSLDPSRRYEFLEWLKTR